MMSMISVRNAFRSDGIRQATHGIRLVHKDKKDSPQNEEFVDENGIRTTIEYTENEEGKRVKVRHLTLHLG